MADPRNAFCRRQRQFLIASALSRSGQMDHGFAAGQIGQPLSVSGMGFQNSSKEHARIPGLAAQLIRQIHRLIAQLSAHLCSACTQLLHAADDLGLHIVQLLRRFLFQQRPDLIAEVQPVFPGNGNGLFRRGRIRRGRAGGDHIQRVAQNVREDHRLHLGRRAPLGKPAALDRGKTLADRVHLHDSRATGQKLLGDVLQLFSRDQRLFKQGASAAGEQEQHRVGFQQVLRHVQSRLRGQKAVLIGNRVTGLIAAHPFQRIHHMVILCNHHAVLHRHIQTFHGRGRHLPRRFTGRNNIDPSGEYRLCQGAAHRLIRLHRRNRSADNLLRIPT